MRQFPLEGWRHDHLCFGTREAMKLTPRELTQLADTPWESMGDSLEAASDTPEISAEWREEIARRSEAYKRGELQPIPWAKARDEVQRSRILVVAVAHNAREPN